ncbi:flagellar biosynthetic protein FliR [Fretibacter rubidus]|uniref:flagellar biosynthetic protein FliR n=1 Tax=Fretibacter rubidus TaxID=570162 RepID=UPI00352A65F0
MEEFTSQILAILLISLRISPTFAFAPPFTLLRVPTTIRVLLGVSLATWLVLSKPEATYLRDINLYNLPMLALGEIIIGTTLMLSLQWVSAAILMIGRAVDVQTGFGLALLIDPTTRSQRPLIGTIFAYAAGAVFFSLDAPTDLLIIWAESIERLPLGAGFIEPNISVFLAFISTAFALATGLAGIIFLTLFLIDLTVAFLSRTLPQMNVLLIGFQVKTLAVLATLPIAIGYSIATYIRLVRLSIETIPMMAW